MHTQNQLRPQANMPQVPKERRQATYRVLTYDYSQAQYTPQVGLTKDRGLTLWELRTALRELRDMGYTIDRKNAHDVLVQREDR